MNGKEILRLFGAALSLVVGALLGLDAAFRLGTGLYLAVREGAVLALPRRLVSCLLLFAVAGALLRYGWQGLRRNRFQDKMERRQRKLTRTLFEPRACGACGGRLIVCRAPRTLEEFPEPMMDGMRPLGVEPGFYCAGCGKFYPVAEGYDPFEPTVQEPPKGDGRQYRIGAAARGLYLSGTLGCGLTLVWIAGQLGWQVWMWHSMGVYIERDHLWIAAALGVAAAAGLLWCARRFQSSAHAYFELAPGGLLRQDGTRLWYYRWEEFLLLQRPGRSVQPPRRVAVMTEQGGFWLTAAVEDMPQLLERIRAALPEKVRIDPSLG